MNKMPKDPLMLLSFVNTQLRDHYDSFEELCSAFDVGEESIKALLEQIGYVYDKGTNQFR